MVSPRAGALPVFPALGVGGEGLEIGEQEPAQPDALALAGRSHAVHPVVPVPGAHERQAVAADREAAVERARAVFVQRGLQRRDLRLEVSIRLSGLQGRSRQEGRLLVEHALIAGHLDVVARRVGEPEQVVGDPSPHALALGVVPPMLHVALFELTRRRAQQVLARQLAARDGERHRVLELVAEPPGSARLVERRARPIAGGHRLVEEPAVEHQVHRPIRRANLEGGERVLPLLAHLGERGVQVLGPITQDQAARLFGVGRLPEQEDELEGLPGFQPNAHLQSGAGVEAGPAALRERDARRQTGGSVETPIAPQELGAIGRPCRLPPARVGERDASRIGFVPGIPREERSRRVELRHDERGRGAPLGPQDPLRVRGDGEHPRAPGSVLQAQAGDLDGVLARHEHEQVRPDPAMLVREAAVPLAVADEIGSLAPDGQRRGAPDLSGFLVAEEEGFPGRVADGVVGPRGELVLAAVAGPRVAGSRLRDQAADGRVGEDVDPGSRGPLPLSQNGDVLAAAVGEASEPVEELQGQARGETCASGGWAGTGWGAGGAGTCLSSRRTCSASVPCRERRMTRAAAESASRSSPDRSSPRSTNTSPTVCSAAIPKARAPARTRDSSAGPSSDA